MKHMTEKELCAWPVVYPLTHKDGTPDKRYSVRPEYVGSDGVYMVLRFCGEYIDGYRNLPHATLRATGHRSILNGAEIIHEQREV